MKFMHLADLHIGKIINGFSMLEDQKYVFEQIKTYIKSEQVDGVLLAGDLYDRSVPSSAAIELFDQFLYDIVIQLKTPIYAIGGNHDGAELLNFGNRLISAVNYHIEGKVSAPIKKVTLHDEYGALNIFLMPFADYAIVREFLQDKDIKSLQAAAKALLAQTEIDTSERNVLLYHGFVIGVGLSSELERSDSEKTLTIGGKEEVSFELFNDFDYVALGHLHGAQKCGRETVRYAGTPLKYSFSEEKQKKSVTIVELKEKGCVEYKLLPLYPRYDMRSIEGTLEDVLAQATPQTKDDYLNVTLTDEGALIEPMAKLRKVYKHTMALGFKKNQALYELSTLTQSERKREPYEVILKFYEENKGRTLNDEEQQVIQTVLTHVGGMTK